MKIYLGADHGGFELKEQLKRALIKKNIEVEDCGAYELIPDDDYPEIAFKVAQKVVSNNDSVGILLCRSGGGMTIAANKVKGARAISVKNSQEAVYARSVNQVQIITVAADSFDFGKVLQIVESFLKAKIDSHSRHHRRIQKIIEFEQS